MATGNPSRANGVPVRRSTALRAVHAPLPTQQRGKRYESWAEVFKAAQDLAWDELELPFARESFCADLVASFHADSRVSAMNADDPSDRWEEASPSERRKEIKIIADVARVLNRACRYLDDHRARLVTLELQALLDGDGSIARGAWTVTANGKREPPRFRYVRRWVERNLKEVAFGAGKDPEVRLRDRRSRLVHHFVFLTGARTRGGREVAVFENKPTARQLACLSLLAGVAPAGELQRQKRGAGKARPTAKSILEAEQNAVAHVLRRLDQSAKRRAKDMLQRLRGPSEPRTQQP